MNVYDNSVNTSLLFRTKQLTRQLNEMQQASALTNSSSQLLALSQLLRIHTAPKYDILSSEVEWKNLCLIIDLLYGGCLTVSLASMVDLNVQELKVCYMVRAHVKNKGIALIFNITSQSVIKAKQRIKIKLGLSATDCFDSYIQTL